MKTCVRKKGGGAKKAEVEILCTFSRGESLKSGSMESKQHYYTTLGVFAVLFFINTCISVFLLFLLFSTERCDSPSTLSVDGIVDKFLSSNLSVCDPSLSLALPFHACSTIANVSESINEETIKIQRDKVCDECIQRTNTYLESRLSPSTKSCGLDILRGLNLHICPDDHFLHLQDGEGHFRLLKCGELFNSVSLIGYMMTSDVKYPLSIYEREQYYDIHFEVFDSGTYSFKIMTMWVNGTHDRDPKNAHFAHLYLGGQELHGGDMDALCQNLSYIHMGPIDISVPVRVPPLKFSGEKCKGNEEGRWRRFDERNMTAIQEWIHYKDEGPWEWVPFTCTYQKYINHDASAPRIIFVGDSHIAGIHSIFDDLGFTNISLHYCFDECNLSFLQQVTNNDIIISNLGIIHHVWHKTMNDAYNDLFIRARVLNYPKKVFFEPWIQTKQREHYITYYRCRRMIEKLIPSLTNDGWKIFNTTKITVPRFEASRDGCHFYSENDKRGSIGKTVANNLVHYLKYLKYL